MRTLCSRHSACAEDAQDGLWAALGSWFAQSIQMVPGKLESGVSHGRALSLSFADLSEALKGVWLLRHLFR